MNTTKTEAMIMEANKRQQNMSEIAYRHRITGEGTTREEFNKSLIKCKWCNTEVQVKSMKRHNLSYKCKEEKKKKEKRNTTIIMNETDDEMNHESNTYVISMPKGTICNCPDKKCPFQSNNRTQMRKHFRARHLDDIIIIEEEGLLPQCVECGLYQKNVNEASHLGSEECKRFAEIRKNKRIDECQKAAKNVSFYINGEEIKKVKQFKYLGRIITDDDNDLMAVEQQLTKARRTWGMIGKVIKKKSKSNPRIMSIFYKVIVQTILLYGSESWVLNQGLKDKLNSFHNRCARYITGDHIRVIDDVWYYPSRKETLEKADLLTIDEYITKRKNTVSIYAEETQIFKDCKEITERTKDNKSLAWWNKNNNICLDVAEISINESDFVSTVR